ncbi:Ras-related protein Rab-11A [Symbiodinium microadriaticum]|uniref:Ras-related protein Rab-11A n=1 Tax=Symbiodinium microadriaticum TaxID=2951 RepID=A0A1Q9E3Y0_SYMMI|nr:Ras-related protein Rab-11A [Symbiodinium microadriaticum]
MIGEEDYDHLYKLVLVGDATVGKTHILSRYIKGTLPKAPTATIGVEFATRTVSLDAGCAVKAQIWDTAGQERYRAITSAHYRRAVGALLVYDITKPATFKSCQRWMEELRSNAEPDIVIMLVGNKVDLAEKNPGDRQVDFDAAADFASQQGLLFEEEKLQDMRGAALARSQSTVKRFGKAPKYGYIGYGDGEDDFEGADPGIPLEDEHDAYVAVMPAGSADDEEAWFDDEDVATRLKAYAAVRRGHHVMPFTGERFSISGFTMTDMDYLSRQDIVFLSQLGFPSYSTGNVAELQAQLVAFGNCEQMNGEDIHADSLTAEQEAGFMTAKVPVYGTTDAGRLRERGQWAEAISSNKVIVTDRMPKPPATTENEPTTADKASAVTGANIKLCFDKLLKEIYNTTQHRRDREDDPTNNFQLQGRSSQTECAC